MAPEVNRLSTTRLDRLVMRHTIDCWRPLQHRIRCYAELLQQLA